MPPSANALFANKKSGGRFRTKAYNDWIAEAGWRIQMQKPGRIAGRYEIEIAIARPKRRGRFDASNRIKATEDLLVKYGLIEDDSLCERLLLTWASEGEGVLVTLTKHQLRGSPA